MFARYVDTYWDQQRYKCSTLAYSGKIKGWSVLGNVLKTTCIRGKKSGQCWRDIYDKRSRISLDNFVTSLNESKVRILAYIQVYDNICLL
jgi:hypothetical protein